MNNRMNSLKKMLLENGLDGVLVYSKENRRFFSGFTGSTGYIIMGSDHAGFITDFRYKSQSEAQCKNFEIIIHQNALLETIKETINRYGYKRIGIEGNSMTVSFYNDLKHLSTEIEFVPLNDSIDALRIIKSEDEIVNLEKAAALTDAAFDHILTFIKPGVSENDVSVELEYFLKKNGASGFSFDAIVASGERSALPHGIASEKIINQGEFLTLDFGCVYNGYCSDMTRTIFIGKAGDKHKAVYHTVLRAQEEALKNIKPGMVGKAVDKIARDIITDAGYGDYFGHGLGHGVGLAVHEEPRLSPIGEKVLEAGMIVTDEPGIYIPGFGGVRIEDLVLVTEDGNRVLSKSPKHLIEI